MQYRDLGNTGIKISSLGFGAMRLPGFDFSAREYDSEKEAAVIKIVHRAFKLGVNYIDTAYVYGNGNNERIVGKIIKGRRQNVYLATKSPVWRIEKKVDYRKFLEEQLRRLEEDYIDFYFFHDVKSNTWNDIILKYDLLHEAEKAKRDGLIRHISVSCHQEPDFIRKLLDTGLFSSVLLQYNLLDRKNENIINYAKKTGTGVVIMGPVAGGRLSAPSETISKLSYRKFSSTPEIALRFVFGNPDVSCALSGMTSIEMVEQNVRIASIEEPLSLNDWIKINTSLEEVKKVSELYCTGCNYCASCPQDIHISFIFQQMIHHKVFGYTEAARQALSNIGKDDEYGRHPSNCTECGLCETKCPQKIKIREQLRLITRELF